MSREYNEYCEKCQDYEARSIVLKENYRIFQCLICGTNWLEKKEIIILKTKGTGENAWKKAINEAYEK